MNEDLNKLLDNLEPIIDKKCNLLKKERKQKRQEIIMILISIAFVTIPSILLIYNISILYFVGGLIIYMAIKFLLKLPDILNKALEVNCYE